MSGDPSEAAVREVVEEILGSLGLANTHVEVARDDETVTATVRGDDLGLLIGRHGQTIDAIQHLAFRVALARGGGGEERALRVVVDAEGYRARRAEALRAQAEDAAAEALRFQRPVALDAMTASERKLVHEHLRDRGDVATHSEGEEPSRHLVVSPGAPDAPSLV